MPELPSPLFLSLSLRPCFSEDNASMSSESRETKLTSVPRRSRTTVGDWLRLGEEEEIRQQFVTGSLGNLLIVIWRGETVHVWPGHRFFSFFLTGISSQQMMT